MSEEEKIEVFLSSDKVLKALHQLALELEFVEEVLNKLLNYLDLSEDEWKHITDQAYENVKKRSDEIFRSLFHSQENTLFLFLN